MKPENKLLVKSLAWAIILGFCANIGIAFLLDLKSIVRTITAVQPIVIVVPFLCYFLIYLIDTLRMVIVLHQLDAKMPIGEAFYNNVAVILFSNLTPFASGGQPYQIYHMQSIGIDSKKATNVVLSRYVEFMVTSLAVFICGIPLALSILKTIKIGREPLILAFAVTMGVSVFVFAALIRPDAAGRFILRFQHTRTGRTLGRLFKKADWGETFHKWSSSLREQVNFLWTEKLWIMSIDVFLGFTNLVLQAGSLAYVLHQMTPIQDSYLHVMMSFVIINFVVYYVPTPGASGSIEAAYIWVFSGLTGSPVATAAAVMIWRFATYYLHTAFGLVVVAFRTYVIRRWPSEKSAA